MCTVSFIPVKDRVFITSNRDENFRRPAALPPKQYSFANCNITFPKDAQAGGTWIALCDDGNAGVLLNGAFERHEKKPVYAESRGLVFLNVMDNSCPVQAFVKKTFERIEPFTLILRQEKNLYECRLDADGKKHVKNLPADRPHIWSSATLYNAGVRKSRERRFANWLNDHPLPTGEEILAFHRFGGDGDKHDGLFMNRVGKTVTVSITGIELSAKEASMRYDDFTLSQQALHAWRLSLYLLSA